jgi:ribosomal protein S27E
VGQAWKADFVQVFAEDPQFKEHRLFKMPRGNIKCAKCGEIIRYDSRGYAFCSCQIHNEPVIKPISETAKQVRMRKYTKFAKRC